MLLLISATSAQCTAFIVQYVALKTCIRWDWGEIAMDDWKMYFLAYFGWLRDWHYLSVCSCFFPSGEKSYPYHFVRVLEPACLCHVCHLWLCGQNGFRPTYKLRESWKKNHYSLSSGENAFWSLVGSLNAV